MASKTNRTKTSVTSPTIKRRRESQTHPNSLANLKPPWKPGQPSPNPGGRPKLLSESYKKMLARVDENDEQGRTNAEIIADKMKSLVVDKDDTGEAREIRTATEGNHIDLSDETKARQYDELLKQFLTGKTQDDSQEAENEKAN